MNIITFLTTSARRCLAAVVLFFVSILPMLGSSDFYYKATVSVADGQQGWGKVYINNENLENKTYVDGPVTIENNISWPGSNAQSGYVYISYATTPSSSEYIFDHWEYKKDNSGWQEISRTADTYLFVELNSKKPKEPNLVEFKAFYIHQNGLVKVAVASGDEGKGTVALDNTDNSVGDVVTLTATPDILNGIHFLGWSRNDDENLIETDNPYSFTIDANNQGTYYAHFSEAPEQIYCRIKNRGTGRYLSLYGNKSATKHERTIGSYNRIDGYNFKNSLKLIEKDVAIGNPMTVFLRSGHPSGTGVTTGVNLSVNTNDAPSGLVSYNSLVNTLVTPTDYPLYMMYDSEENGVLIYTIFKHSNGDQTVQLYSYLTDEGRGNNDDFAMMYSEASDNIYWDVYILDENTDEGSFGANAKADFSGDDNYGESGKYYTTMYTYFPYQLTNGVKAYYLPLSEESYDEEKKEVHFTEVADGIVPRFSAVVLECPEVYNETTNNNRLRPLTSKDFQDLEKQEPSPLIYPSFNLLNGYISLSNNGGTPNKVTNNKKTMFILSKVDGDLGWFYFTNEYMTPNKAYLDLSPWEAAFHERQNDAREIKFVFGKGDEEEATGVISPKYAEEVDGPLFDLNGRRVTDGDAYGLKKGIYISNGKKIVVK